MSEPFDREVKRLAALSHYDAMDTSREVAFDEIVELAVQICEVSSAAIAFIGQDRLFFKAEIGPASESVASIAPYCRRTLLEHDLLVIPDVSADSRSGDQPVFNHAQHIGFYAGAVIKTEHGDAIGTLCICDNYPRILTPPQQRALQVMARQVMTQLELRHLVKAQALAETRERAVVEGAPDLAVIVTDLDDVVTQWGDGAERLLGWTADEMLWRRAATMLTPDNRPSSSSDFSGQNQTQGERQQSYAPTPQWRQRKDGSLLWSSEEATPLYNADGESVGFIKIVRDRTERRLAGMTHDDAEATLRRAQEAGGVGVFHIGLDGIIHATPEFCRIFGVQNYGPAPARVFEDLIIDEDQHLISDVQLRVTGVAPLDVEYRIRRADTGDERWIARKGEIQRDETGAPLRFVGVARDITDERDARESLARSEERYRALFNAIDDGFCIIEFFDGPHGALSDFHYVDANPACGRHTGVPNIVGKTLRDLVEDADVPEWLGLYGTVLRTGEPLRIERYFQTAKRHIEVSAARVEPASRRQVSVLFRDIEDRRQSEQALRKSEALARENIGRVQMALSAGAIIGTWHWDMLHNKFTLDDAFVQVFGLDPAVDQDSSTLDEFIPAIHPDDQEGFATSIAEVMERGGAYSQQFRVRHSDGEYHWIEANGRVDMDESGIAREFPGVLLDIEAHRMLSAERDRATTALRLLNENLEQRIAERTSELMQAEEQLRQAQKMEAVGQLTGGIAHDFNNMLTGVIGSLDLIERNLASGRIERVHRYIEAANISAQRAAALTARLLAFGRRQSLDLVATDVNSLVCGMEELLQRTLGEHVEIETHLVHDLWVATSDTSQLENALLNLCINARDAMPNGGRLTIGTTNTLVSDLDDSKQLDMAPGEYVVLCVSDTGTGMAASTIEKVFDPFFTTKPIGQGTGLGLSMIYGFARQAGGHVRISSQLGVGTIVKLYMPRRYEKYDAQDIGKSQNAAVVPLGAGETVMVVEDDASVRLIVLEVLAELGYQSIEAEDGDSAIPILTSGREIDLLISDVGLPGINGRQLAELARTVRPDLLVLFITGYAQNAAVRGGFLEPGMEMMTKPFAVDELATKIREMLGSR